MTVFERFTTSKVVVLLGFKLSSARRARLPTETREPASPVEA
jgi:hypothetical protein